MLEQLSIESKYSLDSLNRQRDNYEKAVSAGRESTSNAGRKLLNDNLDVLTMSIMNMMNTKTKGKPSTAIKYLNKIAPEATASITLKTFMDGLIVGKDMTQTLVLLGDNIYIESLSQDLREACSYKYKQLQAKLKELNQKGKGNLAGNVIEFYADKFLETKEDIGDDEKLKIGAKLLDILMSCTNLIEKKMHVENGKRIYRLHPTADTLAILKASTMSDAINFPLYPLMVVPPKPWTNAYDGGYLSSAVKPLELVKTRSYTVLEGIDAEIDNMQEVLGAVNTIQETAWKIDPFILDIHNQVIDNKLGAYTKVKLDVFSQRAFFEQCIKIANQFVKYDKVYIPYTLDFRGRIYAAPLLHVQGADWMKALFRFAESKPINTDEEKWALFVHCANTWGEDKVSFEDRVQWVYDNLEMLWDCVGNPMDNITWLEADKPYQFLQAARDVCGFMVEGFGYKSSVPVALDGSCSGIQHFGAMTRDSYTCSQVNLTPQAKPADIYQEVADIIKDHIECTYGELLEWTDKETVRNYLLKGNTYDELSKEEQKQYYTDLESWAWYHFGVTRKVCKRSVMTFAYGSGKFGYADQLKEDFMQDQNTDTSIFEDDGFRACKVMAEYLDMGISKVVSKPKDAMSYLQAIAKETAKENLPVKWVTPLGFPVIQDYRKENSKLVEVSILGQRVRPTLSIRSKDLCARKAASSVSPNFVHSMDATHLMMTVIGLHNQDITDIALVHDSFGVHAANAPELFDTVRHAMTVLYDEHDVLTEFKQLNKASDLEVTRGDYEITTINQCDYAFA